ncbi:MAG: sulfopyruvate decarboxylase subunit beta [Candidatus Hermodarchaeota archaeon]|nr:sulfopyruvate decarboxylase subunit beta [Candidatus Hermodarchaeota archaeon]
MTASDEIISILKEEGINFFTTYPCAKFQNLYNLVHSQFMSLGVTKEEDGVGICAGASLAGAKAAMLIQSTGLGNMINALCSLTLTYELPLLVLASWRGVYKENISAQIKLGKSLPKILEAIGAQYCIVTSNKDLPKLQQAAKDAYRLNSLQIVLLSPELFENEPLAESGPNISHIMVPTEEKAFPGAEATLTRYEILQALETYFENKLVISNIGFPSRELHDIKPQRTNFYMLGSLGLVSSVGLGIALFSKHEVVVIDGDGSLLANLGILASIAQAEPPNLTILAIDNGAHGSTGNQATPTATCVDLAQVTRGLGFTNVFRATNPKEITDTLSKLEEGPNFVHVIAEAGNADVPIIPLSPIEIKKQFMRAIQ